MSHDGCIEVAWKGQAFPYLLHHPSSTRSQNYGQLRAEQREGHAHSAATASPSAVPGSDVHARAAAGTWNGPAPQGFLSKAQHGKQVSSAAPERPQARDMRCGRARMPMAGLSTAACGDAKACVEAALDKGYRAFDSAMVNGNEAQVGEGLRTFKGKRSELFIISKLWNDAKRPDAVCAAVEKSVADLGCEYLDVLLIHWPVAWAPGTQDADPDASLAATWAAMEAAVDTGLVKQLGVANFGLAQVEELLEGVRMKPVCNLVELHPFLSQRKLVGTLLRKGVNCIAHAPTCGPKAEEAASRPRLQELASQSQHSASELMLKWNIQRGVPVMLDAESPSDIPHLDTLLQRKLKEETEKVVLDGLNEDLRCVKSEWATFDDAELGGARKPSAVLGNGKRYN